MKGLELARRFFLDIALPAFRDKAPDALGRMAFGFAGLGSECYSFEDEISRDHDWGPRVCIWVPEELYRKHGVESPEDLRQAGGGVPRVRPGAAGGQPPWRAAASGRGTEDARAVLDGGVKLLLAVGTDISRVSWTAGPRSARPGWTFMA